MITIPGEASSYVRTHWRGVALVGSWLACAALGWWLRGPPPPAVHLDQTDHAAAGASSSSASDTHEGPKRIVHLEFGPAPAPPPGLAVPPAVLCRPLVVPGDPAPVYVPAGEVVTSETIEEDGPVDTHAFVAAERHAEEDHHLQLTVAPVALPRFSVGWAPRVAPGVSLGVIDAGVRVTSDLWISAWAEPLAPAVGVGIRVTF